jgi:hypothetical protein
VVDQLKAADLAEAVLDVYGLRLVQQVWRESHESAAHRETPTPAAPDSAAATNGTARADRAPMGRHGPRAEVPVAPTEREPSGRAYRCVDPELLERQQAPRLPDRPGRPRGGRVSRSPAR